MSEHVRAPALAELPLFATPEDPADTLDPMAGRDARWLDALRAELRDMFRYRQRTWDSPAFVTADDVRRLADMYPHLRPPEGVSNNAFGNVFRTREWVRVGDHVSVTKGAHSNRIGRWALRDDA